MPGGKKSATGGRGRVQFKIVPRPYDEDYEGDASHVWVPFDEHEKNTKRVMSKSQAGSRHRDPTDSTGLGGRGDDDDAGDESGGAFLSPAEMLALMTRHAQVRGAGEAPEAIFDDGPRRGRGGRGGGGAGDGEEEDEEEEEVLFEDAEEVEDLGNDFFRQIIYGQPGKEDAEDRRLRRGRKLAGEDDGDEDDDGDDDDYDDDDLFGEEDEEDDGLFGDDDDDDDDDAPRQQRGGLGEYPKHATDGRAIDRQFERMLNEFKVDADINKLHSKDPRMQGALPVEQFAPVFEEFADERVTTSYVSDDPLKHRGLLNSLRYYTRENRVFDTDKGGEYYVSILPDKATRFRMAFREDAEANKEATKRIIQHMEAEEEARLDRLAAQGKLDSEGREIEDPDDEEARAAGIKRPEGRKKAEHDCETVLTTYSTLYNHPNIIAAQRSKLDPRKALLQLKMGRRLEQEQKKQASTNKRLNRDDAAASAGAAPDEDDTAPPAAAAASSSVAPAPAPEQPRLTQGALKGMRATADEDGADDEDDAAAALLEDDDDEDVLEIDISQRPADETKEEKKIRRQLVKQLQRERRQQKKELGTAYKAATIQLQQNAGTKKQQKAQTSLSMATRLAMSGNHRIIEFPSRAELAKDPLCRVRLTDAGIEPFLFLVGDALVFNRCLAGTVGCMELQAPTFGNIGYPKCDPATHNGQRSEVPDYLASRSRAIAKAREIKCPGGRSHGHGHGHGHGPRYASRRSGSGLDPSTVASDPSPSPHQQQHPSPIHLSMTSPSGPSANVSFARSHHHARGDSLGGDESLVPVNASFSASASAAGFSSRQFPPMQTPALPADKAGRPFTVRVCFVTVVKNLFFGETRTVIEEWNFRCFKMAAEAATILPPTVPPRGSNRTSATHLAAAGDLGSARSGASSESAPPAPVTLVHANHRPQVEELIKFIMRLVRGDLVRESEALFRSPENLVVEFDVVEESWA